MDAISAYRQPSTSTTQATQSPQQTKRTSEARQNLQADNRVSAQKESDLKAQAKTREEPRSPVVNTQGQTTGRLVNTTA